VFLLTRSIRSNVNFILKKFQLAKYFKEIVSVKEQGFTRKPHSSSYEHLLPTHYIDLVVGDRDLDLIPARVLKIRPLPFKIYTLQLIFISTIMLILLL